MPIKDSQQSELLGAECELVSVGLQPVLWHHPAVQQEDHVSAGLFGISRRTKTREASAITTSDNEGDIEGMHSSTRLTRLGQLPCL